MKKMVGMIAVLLCVVGVAYAQEDLPEQASAKPNPVSDRGIFYAAGGSYDYMNIDSDPKFRMDGMSFFVGLGYDFNRVMISLNFDFMVFATGQYQGYGYSNPDGLTGGYMGGGLNVGYKIINGNIFDLTIPLGAYIRSSHFEIHHDNDRKFKYFFVNAESGLLFSWRISKSPGKLSKMIIIPLNIGYPLYKSNTAENYSANHFRVLHYSIGFGFGMRITF